MAHTCLSTSKRLEKDIVVVSDQASPETGHGARERSAPQLEIYEHVRNVTFTVMVRSTIIVRASDALPLAASVDDEQVWPTSQWGLVRAHNRTDGASSPGAQAAVQTHLSTDNTQL